MIRDLLQIPPVSSSEFKRINMHFPRNHVKTHSFLIISVEGVIIRLNWLIIKAKLGGNPYPNWHLPTQS